MRNLYHLFLVGAVFCAAGVYWGSFAYYKAQELDKAAARLTFYQSTVEAELRHFAHLPFLLSQDPFVAETLAGSDPARLDKRLGDFAQSAGIDAIYLMDETGLTISASNATATNSFVGQNYGFRPYFQAALNGELGEFYGIGATTGIPGYFYAMAVRTVHAENIGVIAIKLDLSALQDSWQASGERIILSNRDGVVLLASNPKWRYQTLAPLSIDQRTRIHAARQFGKEKLDVLDWSPDLEAQTAEIGDTKFLYTRTSDLPNSWSLHFFTPDDQAAARAWLITATMVLLGGMIFIIWQVRRVRQIGSALARSESEEAQLRSANERLAVEVEDRRAAERNLKETQADLERASRLAALGQLASSVTHELGQPIAAMRNHLTAAEIATGASSLNDKMQSLVARMENITLQLKFFSRKGRDQFEFLDLAEVISNSLELLTPNIDQVDATMSFNPPKTELSFQGNKLRLEQVATNLIRNALDAVEESDTRQIEIRVGEDVNSVWFEVADTGHGLGESNMEDLREPFATTRESGRGMGLGLTISAGIVSDHGGVLSANNQEEGGAVFRADFWRDHEGPAHD
ncbi:MAG: two-component system C4-dicarboxylate transport sensor histidine kinase DctB [Paracoccaceae bacterium]|jgi:two-component system C4-dicarboxylate transport sensor histidine kinase DctB